MQVTEETRVIVMHSADLQISVSVKNFATVPPIESRVLQSAVAHLEGDETMMPLTYQTVEDLQYVYFYKADKV